MDLMLKLRPSFFFSFLIFIFLLQKPNLGSASSPKCISTERQALLTFKQSLTDPSGRLSSWSTPDCCKWRGVRCDRRTSYVIKIDLRNPNQTLRRNGEFRNGSLGGKIHPSLTRLKFLSYLDMSSNDFNFTEIPEFLGHIVSLRYLNLSFSSFSGEVPASFGNLSKLESLDLYAQTFSDDVFTMNLRASNLGWLSSLSSSLTYLNMGFVSLSGAGETWLQDFSRLSKLKELHLFNCELRSLPLSLPSSANLKLLEVLDLSRNYFYSPTPNWLFDLTSLRKLFLQSNELSGEIPAVLGDLPRLKYLDLSENSFQGQIHRFLEALSRNQGNSSLLSLSNSFTGSIPSSVGNMVSLKKLDLSFNAMNGKIPESLGKLEELEDLNLMENKWEGVLLNWFSRIASGVTELNLENNRIKGTLPQNLVFPNLAAFDLSSNNFQGPFPRWTTYATQLHLYQNNFSGSLPADIHVLMPRLKNIKLFHNSFTGEIPSSLCELTGLETLNLRNNRFSGSFPKCWRPSSELYEIDASENSISGQIPESLCNCSGITHIHLGGNKLTGKLPSWLSKLSSLSMLRLQSNSFDGQIPEDLCRAPSLHILDLSENKLYGPVPKCMGNLTAIIRDSINLSGNNINGEIPVEILDLTYLRILNLSRNSVAGSIPGNISKLGHLEMLDLSSNKFSGAIPQSLGAISSLHTLNLSFNKLEGSIPKNLKFKDPSIYAGNELSKLKELHLFNCELKNLPLSLTSSANLKLLEVLDLSQNSFSSPTPSWLFDLTSLRKLTLQWVDLRGSVPSGFKKLKLLGTLDLSYNALSGEIPAVLGDIPQLKYLDLSRNSFEGQIHMFLDALSKNNGNSLVYLALRNLQILDLSLNSFTGSFPSSVGNMASLKKLALPLNSMNGKIPESLGKLGRLETLDLSSNRFSGAIPQSLAAISSLHTLDLSYNKLEGRIPKNLKFKDPSIYNGNELLCGKPLSKKCPRKQQNVVANRA
uniref:Uncharacterized protein n=1 Tax=Brassica oleracea TaxID=3712 RepID=A0A3P6AN79_BRAOL|nr:unnamed protein product [Brassica oleracea]